jgi:outer membrane protein TolC
VRTRITTLVYLLLAFTAPALCQTTPLTLDDCIRLATSVESAVSLARQQSEIARYGLIEARAGFLPQISVGGNYTYNNPLRSGEFAFISLNGVREFVTQGNIDLELDTSGRLRAALARARADRDAAAAGQSLSERDLKRAVTASYYRLLLARHLAAATRDSLEEARSFEKRARLLASQGEAAQADVVKAAGETAFLQQSLNAAELEAKLANHDLASFWTTDVDKELNLADVLDRDVPTPETPPPPAAAPFLRRLEFRLFDAQRRGFQADARRVRADLYPQLSLVTQYGIDAPRYSFSYRGYAAFLNLRIPVFDWFRTRSAARQFDLQARQVETTSRITERTFSREYRDALARVEQIYAQVAMTETQVKLSEDNLRLSRLRYEGGEGLALDVVAAQSQLTQARANYFTAKANYWNARAELEVASGR